MSWPAHPGAIDADRLGALLSPRFPGVRVDAVALERSESGTNENATLRVRYAEAAGAPERLFVKLPPGRSPQRELVKGSGMGVREVLFYERFAADTPLRVPRPLGAACDPESGDFVLLVEDLSAAGVSFPMGEEGLSVAAAERAVEELAAFHARSLGRAPAGVPAPLKMRAYGAGMLEAALRNERIVLEPAFEAVARLYVDATDAVHEAWETGPRAVVHGDGHLANTFLDGSRVGFFDWGCLSYGPAVRDLSYFVCMSLSVENRRAHEEALLARYGDTLRSCGGAWPDDAQVFAWHRIHAAYCVPAAAPAVLRSPDDDSALGVYARDFTRRASAAVADLDAPGALRDALA